MGALELIEPDSPVEETPQRPLTVIEHAVRSGATPEQLTTLLELQVRADNHQLEMMREKRRMDEEDRKAAAILAFRRDFAAFRGENVIIPKSKHVDRGRAGSFMQAEYSTAADMLSPALARHGFGFRHDQRFGPKPWPLPDNPNNVVPWVWVTCFLEHKDGHAETLELEGPPGDLSANTEIQNMQATASYLKRQSLLAITGTATGGEDDENNLHAKSGAMRNAPGAPDELVERAMSEAMNGTKAYATFWRSISNDERAMLSDRHPNFKTVASEADNRASRRVEP